MFYFEVDLDEIEVYRERLTSLYQERCQLAQCNPSGLILRHLGDNSLSLSHQSLGVREMKVLAAPLRIAVHLHQLDISEASIDNAGVEYLTEALRDNCGLHTLILAKIGLTMTGLGHVCSLLIDNSDIRHLDISGNHLSDKASNLLVTIMKSSYLEHFSLRCNDLGSVTAVKLEDVIASNDTMTELDLSWNHIRLSGTVAIANGIRDNTQLEKLNVAWNGFSVEGAKAMGRVLTGNTTLRELDLTGNRLTDKAVTGFSVGLSRNTGLKTLRMGRNPMTSLAVYDVLEAILANGNSVLTLLDITGVAAKENLAQLLSKMKGQRDKLDVIYNGV